MICVAVGPCCERYPALSLSIVLLITMETMLPLEQGVLSKLSALLLPRAICHNLEIGQLVSSNWLYPNTFSHFLLERFYQQNHVNISCFQNIM